MFDKLAAFLFGRDVFVSYSYDDTRYAEALAISLQQRKLSVFLGGWGASPSDELSRSVIRAAKRCRLLVVVATPSALASAAVQQEINIVSSRQRTVVPIDVNDAIGDRHRWPGTDPVAEEQGRSPSPHVIERIENATTFVRQETRLRWSIATVIVAATTATAWLGYAVRTARVAEQLKQREMTVAIALREANEATMLLQSQPESLVKATYLAAASVHRLRTTRPPHARIGFSIRASTSLS